MNTSQSRADDLLTRISGKPNQAQRRAENLIAKVAGRKGLKDEPMDGDEVCKLPGNRCPEGNHRKVKPALKKAKAKGKPRPRGR